MRAGESKLEDHIRAGYQVEIDKIGLTLDTMKDLYQNLSKDKEIMSVGSLKDQNAKLTQDLAAANTELDELRPLKAKARSDKVNLLLLQSRAIRFSPVKNVLHIWCYSCQRSLRKSIPIFIYSST